MKIPTLITWCALPLLASAQTTPPSAATIAAAIARYESGASLEPLRQWEQLVRDAQSNSQLRPAMEEALAEILLGDATFEGKRFACQYLAILGTEASLPALAKLLQDDSTVGIACLALAPQPSAKAGDVLRAALASRKGLASVQIMHTLGDRRDAASVDVLTALTRDADPAVAQAAVAALGKIGNAPARAAIDALRREAPAGMAVSLAEALLRISEGMLAAGDSEGAAKLQGEARELQKMRR